MAKGTAETPEPGEPRASYDLIGHEPAEQAFLDALEGGRLHHAWLIVGPRGVGKATLAYRMARRALGAAGDPGRGILGAAPDDPVCRRIEAGAHGDLLVLSRPWDEKAGRRRGEITVDEARKAINFFHVTSAAGGRRVCLVDAADELNVNAANAILKTLEEPPPGGLMLLVAHAPGRLPPTIRSRCRLLRLRAPGEAAAAKVARDQLGCDAETAARAAALAEGRPGEAVAIAAAGGAAVIAEVDALWSSLPDFDRLRAHKLADKLALKDAQAARALFFRFAAARARAAARAADDGAAVEAWAELWESIGALERDLDAIHLDAKAVVLETLWRAAKASAAKASAV